jgi:alpha-N-arabinofuranosidase
MGTFLSKHSAIMDKYDPEKRVGLIVDEWGTWYDTEPGASPLYQQNTLRDAIVAAINLNLFNQHSDRVRAAASAQAVNVLQALILTKGPQMVLTPTYHVYDLYRVHRDAVSLPVEVSAPRYTLGPGSVPTLHASASRDARGIVHLSVANLDPNRKAELTVKIEGGPSRKVSGRTLTAPSMTALNDFGAAPSVVPVPFTAFRIEQGRIVLSLPSKSVTVVAIE